MGVHSLSVLVCWLCILGPRMSTETEDGLSQGGKHVCSLPSRARKCSTGGGPGLGGRPTQAGGRTGQAPAGKELWGAQWAPLSSRWLLGRHGYLRQLPVLREKVTAHTWCQREPWDSTCMGPESQVDEEEPRPLHGAGEWLSWSPSVYPPWHLLRSACHLTSLSSPGPAAVKASVCTDLRGQRAHTVHNRRWEGPAHLLVTMLLAAALPTGLPRGEC